MAAVNYRLIDIDALDPDNAFPAELLTPQFPAVQIEGVQALSQQARQLLQRGDQEAALRFALENTPYGADEQGKDLHLQTVLEILGSIKQAEMSPLLNAVYTGPMGTELVDVLMKYLYKGMARFNTASTPGVTTHATGATNASGHSGAFGVAPSRGDGGGMSVLLSWHEKVVDIAGTGAIVRVMTDRRIV